MIDDKVLQNAIEESRLRLSVSVAVRDPLVVIEAKELIHLLHAAQRLRLLQSRERRATTDGLREALEWYGEQARLCRLIHSEGDTGRHALAGDGGKRARDALSPTDGAPEAPPKVRTP